MKHRIVFALRIGFFLLAISTLFFFTTSRALYAQRPTPPNVPERGLIYDGLEIAPDVCPGLYRIVGTSSCTHGPDPAPAGVNVKERVPPTDFGNQPYAAPVQCDGDGVSGKRTQVMYVRASDVADRYNEYLASFQSWVAQVDTIYNDSAAETGGTRHIRFVHDSNCVPVILNVQVPSDGDDNFDATINALIALGFSRTDRKYMLFVDADVYCGIATFFNDDQPGAANYFNTGPFYGRNDNGCWHYPEVVAHELMHNLGAVQNSAPHSTYHQGSFGHCADDYDVMCYQDAPGVIVNIVCADYNHELRFDCNHDDYYHTNPPSGNYLATHWNTANNQFLIGAPQPPGAPHDPTPANNSTFSSDVLGVNVAFQADGDQFRVHAWGNSYEHWTDWTSERNVWLNDLTGQTYYWQAQAKNNVGESSWSDTWSFTIQPRSQAPAVPSNLRVIGSTQTTISIAWDDVANEDGYKISRWSDTTQHYDDIADVGANVTTFTDLGPLACGTWYYYDMRSYNSAGTSDYTPGVAAKTQDCTLFKPQKPCLLSPLNNSQAKGIQRLLDWCDATGATYYKIQARRTSTSGSLVIDTATVLSKRKLKNLLVNNWYYWRVSACNAAGCSKWTSWWKFKVLP